MFKIQILQIKKLKLREIKELSFHLRAYQKVMEPGGESSLCDTSACPTLSLQGIDAKTNLLSCY